VKIGELADRAGVSRDTIRYYERMGLLPKAPRTASGYRQYAEGAIGRVRLVRDARRFGFPLKEVATFLRVREAGGAPCRQVREAAQHLVDDIDRQIGELRAARDAMRKTIRDWDQRLTRTSAGARAHLLEALPAVEITAANAIRSKLIRPRR
jgi:DNA-binding transcriptional MerR regulator